MKLYWQIVWLVSDLCLWLVAWRWSQERIVWRRWRQRWLCEYNTYWCRLLALLWEVREWCLGVPAHSVSHGVWINSDCSRTARPLIGCASCVCNRWAALLQVGCFSSTASCAWISGNMESSTSVPCPASQGIDVQLLLFHIIFNLMISYMLFNSLFIPALSASLSSSLAVVLSRRFLVVQYQYLGAHQLWRQCL